MQKIWSVLVLAVLALAEAALAAELEPACPADRSGCVSNVQKRDNQKIFFRVNNTKIKIEASSTQFTLECLNNSGWLDVAALPRYKELVLYQKIYIKDCVLGNASVPGWLRALNVREEEELVLDGVTESLRASHVAGLNISSLKLIRQYYKNVRLEEDFFTVFQNLIILETIGMQYERPPSGLVKWRSVNAMLTRLYEECLSTLTELYLVEPELRNVSALSAAESLVILTLTAPADELPAPPALPALRELKLHNWSAAQTQWRGTGALRALRVEMSALARLPARWLSASPGLRTLELSSLPLRELPEDLLHANTELRELVISDCGLTSDMLTDKLLYKNVKLEKLDLSRNNLTALPSDRVLARLTSLSELNLSHNQLRAAPSAPAFLSGNKSLRRLALDRNPLGDTCAEARAGVVSARDWSWLQELSQLTTLSLQHTGATRMCRDWLDNMPDLTLLDLQNNLFTNLTFADLHPVRSPAAQANATIKLQGNPITRIIYSAEDYLNASVQKAQATVKIKSKLTCDCDLYLFALAVRNYSEHVRVEPLVCAERAGRRQTSLRLLPLEALQCAADCSDNCTCREVPARRGVVASCTQPSADLARPRADKLEVVELSLAGAGLRALPGALPPALRLLDLRNNSIARAAAREARGLLAGRALRLRLAGNPLQCRCGDRALVDVLLQYQEFVDFDELLCSDGSVPEAKECGLGSGVVALLGVAGALSLGALALLLALAHPRARARLKAALRALGLRGPAGAQPARRYDAFVSFAEADARWVARELVPALESPPGPRRLCLHYRDWAVGEFIPRQIAASVRDSRRTLLVVSDAFARSAWARAEFDEAMAVSARDGRPPPLVLLLAAPAAAALAGAPALAEYLRAATYLRADDPRFRHKLRQAVPAAPRAAQV